MIGDESSSLLGRERVVPSLSVGHSAPGEKADRLSMDYKLVKTITCQETQS